MLIELESWQSMPVLVWIRTKPRYSVKELTGLLEDTDGLGELVVLLSMTHICYWILDKTETSGLYVTKLPWLTFSRMLIELKS